MAFQGHGSVRCKNGTLLKSTLFSTKACVAIKEIPREIVVPEGPHIILFLVYGEAGKRVLKFQANFSEVFEVLSSNDGSNINIQIRLQVFQPCDLHNSVLHVHQPLRDKPLKTAFGSSEKPSKHSNKHRVSLFRLYCNLCGFSREYCCLIFVRILTPCKLSCYALVSCGQTSFA